MSHYRKRLGKTGESIAYNYLIQKGYQILEKNFRTRCGEIDIIAKSSQQEIVIVEVKTYETVWIHPLWAITPRKQKTLRHMANVYRGLHQLNHVQFRFDVILVKQGTVCDHLENVL